MTEPSITLGEGSIKIELDESLYPKDAIYGAAYVFIDRCYVHLDRPAPGRISVSMLAKREGMDGNLVAGEFQNELLGQAWRRLIAEENRSLIEMITSRALGGAAGPPGLDELLATDIGDAGAFEDPLGIAMSWEEKYAKKKSAGSTESAASTDGASAPAAEAEPAKADGPAEGT